MNENKELYQHENGEWALYPHLITCTHKGIQEQKYTDDIDFYEVFEEMYDDFTIDEVKELSYSEEQLARLNEVRKLKYSDFDEIYNYVMEGTIKLDSKILTVKTIGQNRADIDYIAIMTGVEI